MNEYKGIYGEFEYEYVINKSRFITHMKNIYSFEEGMDYVKAISKKYSDATHNCFAFISNPQMTEMKFSDDGEPQGTAGQPMLEVLKKRELACTVAVITRYFGGIKLGAGGLVSAYTKALVGCVDNGVVVSYVNSTVLEVECSYKHKEQVENIVLLNGEIEKIEYGNGVKFICYMPKTKVPNFSDAVANKTNGKATIKEISKDFKIYKTK